MASFMQGLADGLARQEEMGLRRAADRRAEALSLAQLASSAEELEYKRQERKKTEDLRQGMSNLWTSIYNPEVEEKVPVQGAAIADAPTADGQPAPQQFTTQKVRKNFSMGERSEEGRARDLQYMMGYTKLMIDSGKITPEQMKQSMEFTRYLEQEGLKDSLATLMLKPDDQKAAGVLAKRFNLDPASVKFEVITKDAQGKPTAIPKFVLSATNASGTPMQYDVSNALQAIGISTLSDIQKTAGGLAKDASAIRSNDASAALHSAQAKEVAPNAQSMRTLRTQQGNLTDARAEALRDPDPKTNTADSKVYSSMTGLDGKPVEMAGGSMMVSGIKDAAIQRGVSRRQAPELAKSLFQRAQQSAAKKIDAELDEEAKTSGKPKRKLSASEYNKRERELLMDGIPRLLAHPEIIKEIDQYAKLNAGSRRAAMDTTTDVSTNE